MSKHPRPLLTAALCLVLVALSPAAARATSFAQKPQEADKLARRAAESLQKKDWRRAADGYQKALRADADHAESHYGLGVAQAGLKQSAEALASFANVLRLAPNPRVREAHLNAGLLHAEGQRHGEAAESLEQAQKLGELPANGRYFLGRAYLSLGRDAEALAALKGALADAPHAPDAYAQIGRLHLKRNEASEAAEALRHAVRLNPGDAPTLALAADAFLRLDLNEEALAATLEAVRLDARQAPAHQGLGLARLALNKNEEALASFQEALRLRPESYESAIGLGNAYVRLNKFREAAAAFEQAARLSPGGADAPLGLGAVHYSQGNYPLMLAATRQAVQLAPKSADALSMLAVAHAVTGEMDDALRLARQAAAAEPNNFRPQHAIAYVFVRTDRAPEALAAARRAAELKPAYPETQNLLGYVLNQLNQHQEGLEASRRALALKRDPADEGWSHYNIAVSLDKLGRPDEAQESFRKALAAYQNAGRTLDPDELYLMGYCYLKLEQDVQAVAAFRQAVRIRPNFAQARLNLGLAHFASGDRQGAAAELNALKRLDPERASRLQRVLAGRPPRKK